MSKEHAAAPEGGSHDELPGLQLVQGWSPEASLLLLLLLRARLQRLLYHCCLRLGEDEEFADDRNL